MIAPRLPTGRDRLRFFLRGIAAVCGVLAAQRTEAQGVLYVTEQVFAPGGAANGFRVAAYDLATGQPYLPTSALSTTPFFVNSGHFGPIGTDAAGNVFLAADGVLRKYDNLGAAVTSFGNLGTGAIQTSNIAINTTLAVNPSGSALVVPFSANTNQVLAFSPGTGNPVAGFTPITSNFATAVAFDPSGSFLYVSSSSGAQGGSTITRYATTGGAGTNITPSSPPFNPGGSYGSPGALLFQTNSSFLVAENNLGLLARYTITGNTAALDPTFGGGPGNLTGGPGWIGGLNGLGNGGLAADASGNLYVLTSAFSNGSLLGTVAKLSPNGTLLNANFISLPSSVVGSYELAIGLMPVPEPSTLGLLALGGLALATSHRRRWRN